MPIHHLPVRGAVRGVQSRTPPLATGSAWTWWLAGAVLALLATVLWWAASKTSETADGAASLQTRIRTTGVSAARSPWLDPSLGTEEDLPTSVLAPEPEKAPLLARASDRVFAVDQDGRLVLNGEMRLKMENLVVLTPPHRLAAVLEEQLASLPPVAAAAARDLVYRYEGYMTAQKLSSSSAQAPLVPEDGLTELSELQALRQSYFGKEAAQRLYGEEEAVTRQLLELMRDDPVPDAPMAEKAVRAQARYDALR